MSNAGGTSAGGSMSSAPQSSRAGIRRSRQIVSRVVADEAIVVPIGRPADGPDSVYTFNESGTTLWAMIEGGRNIAELADYLRAEYGLSSEQAAADALQFVAEL